MRLAVLCEHTCIPVCTMYIDVLCTRTSYEYKVLRIVDQTRCYRVAVLWALAHRYTRVRCVHAPRLYLYAVHSRTIVRCTIYTTIYHRPRGHPPLAPVSSGTEESKRSARLGTRRQGARTRSFQSVGNPCRAIHVEETQVVLSDRKFSGSGTRGPFVIT